MLFRAVVIGCFALLVACSANQSPEQLASQGKWFDIGVSDGERGIEPRSDSDLAKLGSANVASFADYDQGYQQGITNYCDVNNAYSIGLAGMPYRGICAGFDNGARFNLEWQRGYQAYQSSL